MSISLQGNVDSASLTLLAIALLFPQTVMGTSVAILTNGTKIIVAADSKAVDGFTGKRLPPQCKIATLNDITWAASGTISDSESGLRITPLIERAVQRGRGILEIAKYFTEIATPQIGNYLGYNAQHHRKALGLASQPLEVAFLGFEFGQVVVAVDVFTTTNSDGSGDLHATRYVFTGDGCAKGCFQMMGFAKAANAYIERNPAWVGHMVSTARKLIGVEIADEPRYVGGPTDILEITAGGRRWISAQTCRAPVSGHKDK
jgi:hypothetical protein